MRVNVTNTMGESSEDPREFDFASQVTGTVPERLWAWYWFEYPLSSSGTEEDFVRVRLLETG